MPETDTAQKSVAQAFIESGDLWNAVMATQMNLGSSENWPDVKNGRTFAEYVRNKFRGKPQLAEEIIAGADQRFVTSFDNYVAELNEIIGAGVIDEAQAGRARDKLDEINHLVNV